MNIEIIPGKKLTLQDAKTIDESRFKEFGKGKTKKHIQAVFDKELFFLLRDTDKNILALGCLEDITLTFLKKKYAIKGIGGIVSLEKGKGYGKLIMTAIREYLVKNRFTGIGFCLRFNTPFYEKCNFKVKKDSIERFIKKTNGKIFHHPDDGNEDTLYIDGKDKCMKEIRSHPKAKVYVPRFW